MVCLLLIYIYCVCTGTIPFFNDIARAFFYFHHFLSRCVVACAYTCITRETVRHVHPRTFLGPLYHVYIDEKNSPIAWYKICHEHDDKAQCQVSLSRSNVHARYLVRIKSDAIHARHAFYYESWNRTAKLYKCIYQIN